MASSTSIAHRPTRSQLVGLLLITVATLLLQLSWTRILSVSLWYHFAFLVVSTALLGFGLSGVIMTVSKRIARLESSHALVVFSAAQALAILGGYWLTNQLPFAPFALLSEPDQLLLGPIYLACIALPFVLSGMIVALLLSRHAAHAGLIYSVDLLGAGIGCLAIIIVIPGGASTAIVVCASLSLLGCFFFARDHRQARYLRPLTLISIVSLAALIPYSDTLLPLRISHTKRIGNTSMHAALHSSANLHTAWNTFSRVDVLPAKWGRAIIVDAGTAMTRMPRLSNRSALKRPVLDELSLVLPANNQKAVLVIGSGGGYEVAAALRSGARRIVAVEVNPIITQLVRGPMAAYVGNIFNDPRVEIHNAEARNFIHVLDDRFDLIMAAHTLTNAATATGALSLSENYLVTVEAFESFFAHLSPGGMIWMSRPESQLPRLAATAIHALRRRGRGVDPGACLALFAGGAAPSFYGGMIASNTALSAAFIQQIKETLERQNLRTLYVPGESQQSGPFRHAIDIAVRHRTYRPKLRHSSSPHANLLAIAPTTDDKPFFNLSRPWSSLRGADFTSVFRHPDNARAAVEESPVAQIVLLVLLIQSMALAGLLIVIPLIRNRRDGLRSHNYFLAYFSLLGLGFVLVEISLVQRLTLYIGQPVHAFASVVGSLLISSGIGSLASQRWVRSESDIPGRLWRLLFLCGAVLIIFNIVIPPLLTSTLGWPLWARFVLTIACLAPVGLVLGTAFPLGLRHANQIKPRIIPWAWGLNAVTGVVGSIIAIIAATMIGFSAVTIAAALCYFLASMTIYLPACRARV